ncbi:MAG: hypothetical protein BWX88_01758 [Planctomycetes bacterium ADurb.Bin126]|nr:MAG: hypothetical protein BWX88_01758 [Planctomycetes bacterium ADurb.Bin126]HOD84194.1 Nramp family divalent metal transporter [Phycisphaerae bacterium]HQL74376.1 Nramp family divalent metal transporter [Phycisphaerae bacterium]
MPPKKTPKGLLGLLMVLGPSLVWCGEYIGSGEVIVSTRAGAVLGPAILWAVTVGIFLKYWIGLCGGRYTVVTGEAMIDGFARLPGPRNWMIWITLIGQAASAVCSIGAIAVMASVFLGSLFPLGDQGQVIYVSIVTVFVITIAWLGRFDALKWAMGLFVGVIVLGVAYVAVRTLPSARELLIGLFGFQVPDIPLWARQGDPDIAKATAWGEILPLIGWSAGGFASQVWYTYWVMGAGYGMAAGRQVGTSADTECLASMTADQARELKPWLRAVAFDATVALVIGTVVTGAFLLAGSGILRPLMRVPKGPQVALQVSEIFSQHWSAAGGMLFLAAGAAAMVSTQLGQLAGWPRLLADCTRHLSARFARIAPLWQYRLFLSVFLVTNLLVCWGLGTQPVVLVKFGAIFDGLLLVPLQALAVAYMIFVAQKKMLSADAAGILRPGWYHLLGLVVAAIVFGYFCAFQVPSVLTQMLGG